MMEEDFQFDSLFLSERKCKTCGLIKDLMSEFYVTHRHSSNAYSSECKQCAIKRASKNRKKRIRNISDYPDW